MNFDWDNFSYDEAWLRQAVQVEAEAGCDIQIGGATVIPQPIQPSQFQSQFQRVQILSILFAELQSLLHQANLGAGTETAFAKGRQLIYEQLTQLSPEQHAYFEALVVESQSDSEHRPLRSQLTQVLCNLLSPDNWEEIAQAAMASIQYHLLQQVSLRLSA